MLEHMWKHMYYLAINGALLQFPSTEYEKND